jgi:hypothetical protein
VSAALAAASPAKAAALRQARMRASCRFFIYTESIRKTDYGLTQLKIADQVVICAAPALGHGVGIICVLHAYIPPVMLGNPSALAPLYELAAQRHPKK